MNNTLSDQAHDITNLLYRYCELIDSGRFDDAAGLFRHARIRVGGSAEPVGAQELLSIWRNHVIIYPDGTPRTRHLVSNPIVEIDPSMRSAKVRSCYSVYQATDGFPLQLIGAGRYHDEFECVDGQWRFSYRDYSLFDFRGDLSHHLKGAL